MEPEQHRPKKSLGQNFLMHQATADRIADVGVHAPTDVVLEIGPGTGMLTRALLQRASKVYAVEADSTLVGKLTETFAAEIEEGRLVLTSGDVRTFDASSITGAYRLVANIPYYITGEIIRQFLTEDHKPSSMTLLVQKEVAVRIARAKKESILSLSVKAYGTPSYAFTVPKGAFWPAPSVDSAVLSITEISKASFQSDTHEKRFFEVVRAGFAHKRKLLARNLEAVASPKSIHGVFESLNLSLKARAEDLSLANWLSLGKELKT